MVIRHWKCIVVVFAVFFGSFGDAGAQVQTTSPDPVDSIQNVYQQRQAGGIEAGYGWRTDGFNDVFFRAFYEAEVDNVFLNAGVFLYRKIDSGFGFDFRLRMPSLFYPGGRHKNFSPFAGLSFTVWQSTVAVGIPVGIEYEFPVEHFPVISVSTVAAPQINLSSEKNTVVFDIRLGIRFD